MLESVLITGANSGLGKECARQLALEGVKKIYLGCRNEAKAKVAKADLEQSTGKSVFEILLIDVSSLDSVRSAIATLNEAVEGLVMNAGGMGGRKFNEKTATGVTQIFAVNVLGHVLLVEELLKAKKLTKVGLYISTEAARGIPAMGIKQPSLETASVDEFTSIADGSFWQTPLSDAGGPYSYVKYMATLWFSALARQYPDLRLISISPGGTTGTEVTGSLFPFKKAMFKAMMNLSVLFGKMHKVDVGAKRFVDGLNDPSYKTGGFYASKKGVSGTMINQGDIFSDFNNHTFQENASKAIHKFIK